MSRHHRRLDQRKLARWRQRVLDRDGWRCRECGKAGLLEADHIEPLDRGGKPFDLDNGQALCKPCHKIKTAAENRRQLGPRAQAWADAVKALIDA